MSRILVIPDTQCKSGIDMSYLEFIGKYWLEKQPDIVVHIGDHADMPSLSSYDAGTKSFEGRRYKADIEAAREGMDRLLKPISDYNHKQRKNGKKQYKPRMVLTLGNHENRINRAVNTDPKLDGTIGIHDLRYEDYGWDVRPFLEVVVIDGIAFSHYFVTGSMGRPASSAQAILAKKHQSCIAGHQQGRQVAYGTKADGSTITAIIAGSSYEHEEEYMGIQGNRHWRGVVMLHEAQNGSFDESFISSTYLRKKYGKVSS